MQKTPTQLRAIAWEALSGKWLNAAVLALVYGIVAAAASYTGIGTFLVTPVLVFGYAAVLLMMLRGDDIEIGRLFDGFRDYQRIMVTMLLQMVYTMLWSLLLVIPGIIKSYSYAMTPFILKDDTGIANNAAIEKSMAMMEGNKMRLFILDLSFLGWIILGMIPCGLGLLFVQPYMMAARAAFYEELKASFVEPEIIVTAVAE